MTIMAMAQPGKDELDESPVPLLWMGSVQHVHFSSVFMKIEFVNKRNSKGTNEITRGIKGRKS